MISKSKLEMQHDTKSNQQIFILKLISHIFRL